MSGKQQGGRRTNPRYEFTFAFNNDFPALLPAVAPPPAETDPLLIAAPEAGICRVVWFFSAS